ncbi:zinc transporter ZIP11 isoform X2 [Phlebotomus papatasi]|uniref:zinc transporter ZIP11 isoform X2 n=1 Tax=Phlebotomus papatasi TaxID=29031 RepID=UPI002483F6BD|nr:zinc transporter ZIP11 isoform X2 [Phlebotomus papatasi]XP_055707575.1 zinc transporter ZIP11 isoform X2 [Phlebotomus papatasi]
MIQGYGPVTQALLGTLLTWGLTAAGAAMVIFLRGNQRKSLDVSLGFAAGVMIAASFWSLLAPAIELAEASGTYGANGQFAFVPVAAGFFLGSIFVYGTDKIISYLGINSTSMMIGKNINEHSTAIGMDSFSDCISVQHSSSSRRRRKVSVEKDPHTVYSVSGCERDPHSAISQWKRIMLLVVAITVHNIPEGLAVGVSFGAIGTTESATFEAARNLAIGIGIQNFPEGLAVSLPLHATGFSMWKSFWYGQLSGMVEPIFGILGAVAVTIASAVLPYALSFAAGAMIYIVADDILPEAHASGNGLLATWGTIFGFLVMMCLDVGLG